MKNFKKIILYDPRVHTPKQAKFWAEYLFNDRCRGAVVKIKMSDFSALSFIDPLERAELFHGGAGI